MGALGPRAVAPGLARAGVSHIESLADDAPLPSPAPGSCILIRGEYFYDERLLSGLLGARNVVLVSPVPSGDGEVRPQGWHWLGLLSDIGVPPALVKNYVKWANSVKSKDSLVDSVSRGCQIAMTIPRGPVFLSVPTEILPKSWDREKIVCLSL